MRNPAAILGGIMALGMVALPIRRYRDSSDWPERSVAPTEDVVAESKSRRIEKPVARTVTAPEPVQRPVSRQVRRRAERLAKKRGQ